MADSAETEGGVSGQGRNRLWSPAFALIIVVTFCTSMLNVGLSSGTSLYGEAIGLPPAVIGIVTGLFMVSATVMRVFSGAMTDAYSHKGLYLAGAAIMAFGCFLPAVFASAIAVGAARIIQGTGYAISTTVVATMCARAVPVERLAEGMGYRGLGVALATAVGPMVAVAVMQAAGGEALHLVFGGIMALCFGLGTLFREPASVPANDNTGKAVPSVGTKDPAVAPLRVSGPGVQGFLRKHFEPAIAPVTVIEALRRLTNGACSSFAVLYGSYLGLENPGMFFIAASVAIMACRGAGGRLLNTTHSRLLLVCVFGISGLGFFLLMIMPSSITFLLAGLLYGIHHGISSPHLSALSMKRAPKDRWGVVNANFYLIGDLGLALGSFLCGVAIDMAGYQAMPGMVIASSVLSIVAVLVVLRPARPV